MAIRVRDKGPGIPASERKAIFHKFVRGSAAASGGVKGMGVGWPWCTILWRRTAERFVWPANRARKHVYHHAAGVREAEA